MDDSSLDGKLDIVFGTDNWNYGNGHVGGQTYYLDNAGGTQRFRNGTTQQLSFHRDPHTAGALYDFDLGFKFDYDGDPDHPIDLMMADGNDSGTYFIFANRVVTNYVTCGSVTSNTLDIGALANQDMTISGVELTPSITLNGGTVAWEASNDGGRSWRHGTPCPTDNNKVCVTFDKDVGRQIQWRANLCSNSTQTASPKISNVAVGYSYVVAQSHVRAGPSARSSSPATPVGATRSMTRLAPPPGTQLRCWSRCQTANERSMRSPTPTSAWSSATPTPPTASCRLHCWRRTTARRELSSRGRNPSAPA
jgi:hypothetical protein